MPAHKLGKPEGKRDYFNIKSQDDSATIYLFGIVGDWDTDAIYFRDKLKEIGNVSNIDLHINSEGGSVTEGVAIYNMLKAHPAQITVYNDGLAASMASFISMVGDLIVMPENAMMMIHNPRGGFYGERKDLEKAQEMMEKYERAMATAYMDKTGKTEEEILAIMAEETWLTGSEAVAEGFADVLEKPIDMAACANIDLSRFKNTPEFLKPSAVADTPKESEMPTTQKNPATEGNPVDTSALVAQAQADALKAEKTRRQGIQAIFKDHEGFTDLKETCLDDMNMSVEKAKNQLLEAIGNQHQPMTGRIQMGKSEHDNMIAGFSAALEARAGVANDNPQNNFRALSMKEMAGKFLEMRGISTSGMGKMELVGAAFTHSSSDFGNLLKDVAHKSMLKGYGEAEESFERFCTEGELSDFKPTARTDIGTFPSLDMVRKGAEFKQATIGDRGELIQLATYGNLFSISRQAIINDDLRAFTRLPSKFGSAAKRTIGDLVFAILTGNPKMADNVNLFHATHKNLGAGALNSTNLDALRVKMATQKDGAATLNIRPSFLLVPEGLRGTANSTVESEFEVSGSKNLTVKNPVAGLAEVIADARLDASSATAFYLLAGKIFDTIEVAYLDGIKTPRIEQQTGWNVDGTEFKVAMDTGVKALDYRTMAKSTGA